MTEKTARRGQNRLPIPAGDPTGDVGNAKVINKFGEMPHALNSI
jgi:hypothetical protein